MVDDQGETKVQSQGGGYKIETSKEQTFDNTYVSLKASIKETNNEGVFLYTMKIKPKRISMV